MQHLLSVFFLPVIFFSCADDAPPKDLLDATRDRFLAAESLAFDMSVIWNNTFSNDTTIDQHQAVYLKGGQEAFPYDYLYVNGNWTSQYRDGDLTKMNADARQVITYSKKETLAEMNSEGSYATGGGIFGILKDTAWQLSGKEGDIVTYEYVSHQDSSEDGRILVIERITLDEDKKILLTSESLSTRDEEPLQHVVHVFSNYRFNEVETLSFDPPPSFITISNSDLEKAQIMSRLSIGDPLPHFNLTDIDGNHYSSRRLDGRKVVLVFSYIGCGGCEYTRTKLEKIDFELDDDYLGLYVNPINTEEQLRNYRTKKNWPFPLISTEKDFSELFGVYVFPTFVTADENLIVQEVVSGYDAEYFENKAKK